MAFFKKLHDVDVATTEKSGASTVDVSKLFQSDRVKADLDALEILYNDVSKDRDDVVLIEKKTEAA